MCEFFSINVNEILNWNLSLQGNMGLNFQGPKGEKVSKEKSWLLNLTSSPFIVIWTCLFCFLQLTLVTCCISVCVNYKISLSYFILQTGWSRSSGPSWATWADQWTEKTNRCRVSERRSGEYVESKSVNILLWKYHSIKKHYELEYSYMWRHF